MSLRLAETGERLIEGIGHRGERIGRRSLRLLVHGNDPGGGSVLEAALAHAVGVESTSPGGLIEPAREIGVIAQAGGALREEKEYRLRDVVGIVAAIRRAAARTIGP